MQNNFIGHRHLATKQSLVVPLRSSLKISHLKLILILILLLSSIPMAFADEEIRGNKKLVEVKKVLEQFYKIDLKIFGNVKVICGAMPMVTITTDENIQPHIFTAVNGNTLKITSEGWIEPSKLSILVQLPFITDFDISGWGNVTIENVASEHLRVHAPTGNIKLSGKVKNLAIENGTGNVNAEELEAENVVVNKKGWGNISVWATETLQVKGNYGLVNYKGEPKLLGNLENEIVNAQRIEKAPPAPIPFVNVTFKNNSNSKQNFIINGPQRGKHVYGFPINAAGTRKESCPVGSKIYIETLGLKGKLLVEVTAEDEGKTIELFK